MNKDQELFGFVHTAYPNALGPPFLTRLAFLSLASPILWPRHGAMAMKGS